MSAARQLEVLEMRCSPHLQATRRRRADQIPMRVDGREPHACGEGVVGEVTRDGRPGAICRRLGSRYPTRCPEYGQRVPRCGVPNVTRWRTPTSAVQHLHVVPSDQSAFRMAHEIDTRRSVWRTLGTSAEPLTRLQRRSRRSSEPDCGTKVARGDRRCVRSLTGRRRCPGHLVSGARGQGGISATALRRPRGTPPQGSAPASCPSVRAGASGRGRSRGWRHPRRRGVADS
jgi:hypothetical protein